MKEQRAREILQALVQGIDPMTGEELASLVSQLSQTPTSVIERINRMLGEFKK